MLSMADVKADRLEIRPISSRQTFFFSMFVPFFTRGEEDWKSLC